MGEADLMLGRGLTLSLLQLGLRQLRGAVLPAL